MLKSVGVLLLLLFFGTFFLTTNPAIVYACSGGAPLTVAGLIRNSDYVVKARVAEIDDEGQNATLRVENYLAGGTGPEFLLLVRNPPLLMNYANAGRPSGGDCLGLYTEFQPNEEFYAFLARDPDGSYQIVTTLFNSYLYSFPDAKATVEVFLKGGLQDDAGVVHDDLAESGSGQQVMESQFVQIVADQSKQTPASPDSDSLYPLKAPLQITTTSGEQYLLPIDGFAPIRLTPEILSSIEGSDYIDNLLYEAHACKNCRHTYSPDGLNLAVQLDANTIQFIEGSKVSGQAVLFSSTSDMAAVWNHCQLTIYTLGYPRLLQTWYQTSEINQVTLNSGTDCASFFQKAVWSPDGLTLAYTDAKGLWLWDVLSPEVQPRLLVAASPTTQPAARYFSLGGHYLAITQGSERSTIDILSGQKFPDGLVSPDDRLLLAYDTAKPSPLAICSLSPYQCQPAQDILYTITDPTTGENGEVDGLPNISQVEWQDKVSFITFACVPDAPTKCTVFRWESAAGTWWSEPVSNGLAFDYDVGNRSFAVATDGTTIKIGNRVYNLEGKLDAEIENIAWMPSLFYHASP